MNEENYFQNKPEAHPMIYAYSDTNFPGMLKIGYTSKDVDKRVAQQYPVKTPKKPYKIVLREPAIRPDGTTFMDHEVHRALKKSGFKKGEGEWFECEVKDVKAAINAVRARKENEENRTETFELRPEQCEAIERAVSYFRTAKENPRKSVEKTLFSKPRFLWNAKMRFGKTFATYKLAQRMKFKRVLILTFKPAVQSAWREDLLSHVDFEGWQFIAPNNLSGNSIDIQYQNANKEKPIVCFGSFQDFLGEDKKTGGIKTKNEWVHAMHWDLVVFDEYHFGAWRDNAKKLFEEIDEETEFAPIVYDKERLEKQDESFLPITANFYLYLSGTPFRALNSGEFIEEQVYSWTYSDEQRAKANWKGSKPNPYEALPPLVLLTYRLPEEITKIAEKGEFNEFDLNVFFSAEGEGESATFKYKEYVQKWLDLIRGSWIEKETDNLKQGKEKALMPFSDTRLLKNLSHTLWFLPNVASCFAMANLLTERQNTFYQDYKVNVCAGAKAGVGLEALSPVEKSMGNPLETKTITLTCGKLTTGVTVKPWTGIFMLRNLASPETYFQSAFRVQSPWTIDGEDGKKIIIKQKCYVFDFALDRALKQIADYSCNLSIESKNLEEKVEEFTSFLPVLAYDGSVMRPINASEILDFVMVGTTATLLARGWQSARLVNVDNDTLQRILNNKEALAALENIEGFRNLNKDIETIINKSEKIKKAKKDGKEKSKKEKKELSEEEKEFKSKRKEIQEKLIKFATRIPIFMYLSDYREETLIDVITQLEPNLFERVTGLKVGDFHLLCKLGVFNAPLMNEAVYNFKRYEDASLVYTGVDSHAGDSKVGGFDEVVSKEEYLSLYERQQASMLLS